MATRLYLSSTATTVLTPSFAAWFRTTEGDRRLMSVTKDSSAFTEKSVWAGGGVAVSTNALCRQYISAPMAAGNAFVTTDTIKMVVRCRESATNDNINRQPVCVKIYSEDGTILRKTLKALLHYGPNTTEWNTSLRNKQVLDGDTLDPGSAYTTVAGDRLVIEVGGQVSAAGGTSVTGYMEFGSNSVNDLAENETGTDQYCPWFEISRDISWVTTGWTNITKINGTTATDWAKVNGIAVADIAKIGGWAV